MIHKEISALGKVFIRTDFGKLDVLICKDDCFVNSTKLCKSNNKLLSDWIRLKRSQELILSLGDVLSSDISYKIMQSDLIGESKNINDAISGTYFHPKIAIHIAQWISVKCALICTEVVINFCEGKLIFTKPTYQDEFQEICNQINNLKLEERIDNDIVYVISTDVYRKQNIYKIGYTSNISKRLCKFNSTRIDEDAFSIDYQVKGNYDIEQSIHLKLDEYRLNNELFKCDIDIIKSVISLVMMKSLVMIQ